VKYAARMTVPTTAAPAIAGSQENFMSLRGAFRVNLSDGATVCPYDNCK
jgi:hypothetical protein